MADLTYRDWGRIYAYVFSEKRHNPQEYQDYKDLIEKNPVEGVSKVINELNAKYKNNPINFNPNTDAICDVIDPPLALMGDDKTLTAYREGTLKAHLILRLAC